ncbi:hypothetical protein M3557_16090, partial [Bhargavaea ginsengi]|uniref:hypothetical protein n=1 Tax=Bhargavaea ginsengi TaxID=426757 RepID=UPI00204184CF
AGFTASSFRQALSGFLQSMRVTESREACPLLIVQPFPTVYSLSVLWLLLTPDGSAVRHRTGYRVCPAYPSGLPG